MLLLAQLQRRSFFPDMQARSAAKAVATALADVSSPSPAATPADPALWGWASGAERAGVGALLGAGVLPGPGDKEPGKLLAMTFLNQNQ